MSAVNYVNLPSIIADTKNVPPKGALLDPVTAHVHGSVSKGMSTAGLPKTVSAKAQDNSEWGYTAGTGSTWGDSNGTISEWGDSAEPSNFNGTISDWGDSEKPIMQSPNWEAAQPARTRARY